MKKVTKALGIIIVSAVVLGSFGATVYCYAIESIKPETVIVEKEKVIKLPGEVKKRVVTVDEIESKLVEMSELTTYADSYTVTLGKDESRFIFDDVKVPWTRNSVEITANGIVKVGYDVRDISVRVDDFKI